MLSLYVYETVSSKINKSFKMIYSQFSNRICGSHSSCYEEFRLLRYDAV
jgi:hypothetical protein